MNPTNLTISDGLVFANWVSDSGSVRILVKDFAGQTVLDATFENVEWYFPPSSAAAVYGVDEDYLYFFRRGQYIAASRDGSEIRLLFDRWPD